MATSNQTKLLMFDKLIRRENLRPFACRDELSALMSIGIAEEQLALELTGDARCLPLEFIPGVAGRVTMLCTRRMAGFLVHASSPPRRELGISPGNE